jgi:hypothetical protein
MDQTAKEHLMALQTEEENELIELVEEQSDVIKEMCITQNALLSILVNKGYITGEELEEMRNDLKKEFDDAE